MRVDVERHRSYSTSRANAFLTAARCGWRQTHCQIKTSSVIRRGSCHETKMGSVQLNSSPVTARVNGSLWITCGADRACNLR